jgi:hypothetical protein
MHPLSTTTTRKPAFWASMAQAGSHHQQIEDSVL